MPAQLGQPRFRDVAVVGAAQYLLHLFHARIQLLAEWRRKTIREHFHRVTQPFAGNSYLMQVCVILEIAGSRPIQFMQPSRQERPGQSQQNGVMRKVMRRTNRGCRGFEKGVKGLVFFRAGCFQIGLGGAARPKA